jgi:tetratricopeptide (TPR) repeat protein
VARISLCIIARDEEEMLPGCLESVRGAVDEIVLVDTGSRDRTPDIARDAGARVFSLPWQDDFSAPRNEAARRAGGDVLLQLDADERLAPGGAASLRAAAAQPGVDAWLLRLHDADRLGASPVEVISGQARSGPPALLPRLVRRAPDLEWRGSVHESISDWLAARGMRTAPAGADIVHLGHVDEVRAARGKGARNLGLLRRRCALEPESVTPLGYLALELIGAGETREAAQAAERGWALVAQQPADRSILRIAVARGLVALRELRPAAVLEAAAVGLAREGPQPDLLHLRGQALALQAAEPGAAGRAALLGAAGEAFREALRFEAAGPPGGRQYVAGASSWASWDGLGAVRLAERRGAEAVPCFERALLARPGDREARLGLAEVELERGRASGALVILERLLDEGPDGWTLAAAAARALGHGGDAGQLLRCARARLGRGFAAAHRAERLRALEGDLGAPFPRGDRLP